ncbi:MAG: hypothetical protein JWN61_2342 [Pseudonocardiales bacterium]|nr:hypothetical protein [Pseudonocardiales bacterium]
MADQQILFTAMPRGMTQNLDPLPVSVYVSPRLTGADRLRAFPDWVDWTGGLAERGLSLTFRAGARELTVPVSTSALEPRLWQAMFAEDTFVRSHEFVDYSDRAIFSYPVRFALSSLKSIYARAGVDLALPDRTPRHPREPGDSRYRSLLRELYRGLDVGWTGDRAQRLRTYDRESFASPGSLFPMWTDPANLGADGLIRTLPGGDANTVYRQRMIEQFAVVTHQPLGAPIADNPPDFDNLIDFHQALSSLNSYPELMRALGLVLDVELPAEFLDLGGAQTGTLAVVDVPGVQWLLPTTTTVPDLPALSTAYAFARRPADGSTLFVTAPAGAVANSPELEAFGLLNISSAHYGLAQVDVDGALHKSIMMAETWTRSPEPPPSDHPEVFDETTTLPSLRSGGLSMYADGRARRLLARLKTSKAFNDALAGGAARPFTAEDLVHGYRIDIWDSLSNQWHSLHHRSAQLTLGGEAFLIPDGEGFTQLAVTQSAPDPSDPPANDLYLHEAMFRWAGWSLSVPPVGRSLSSDAEPENALTPQEQNAPATPFPMTTNFAAVPGTLPSLRFGRRYRVRARVVDLCGNSLAVDDPLLDALSSGVFTLPSDAAGFPYLRYEPVGAPLIAVRDAGAIRGPGSTLTRLIIRRFNADPSLDEVAPDLESSDRHLLPPRTSADAAEKLGMFDGPDGRLIATAGMWDLIGTRDAGQLPEQTESINGHDQTFAVVPDGIVDALPYLPDALAAGIALRDAPGAPEASVGRVRDLLDPDSSLGFAILDDPNPRDGSATLVGYGSAEWQSTRGIRLALRAATGSVDDDRPQWDGNARVLSIALPTASESIVPLTSYVDAADLRLLGVWQWIREYIDSRAVNAPEPAQLEGLDVDRIAHVLQRAVEGGHWMLTPPTLLRLVHAVQQPIGVPRFTAIAVQHEPYGDPDRPPYDESRDPSPEVTQAIPEHAPTAAVELAPISAWRRPGAIDAVLLGGISVHGASTEKIDLTAEWTDSVDDLTTHRLVADPNVEHHSASVDEIPIRTTAEGYLYVNDRSPNQRAVGFYDEDHDLVALVRDGDALGNVVSSDIGRMMSAAPRHHLGDTRHHRIAYTATATSRFRDCFLPDVPGGFTRASAPIVVEVPASERPQAPAIAYVVPTFGWQRQTDTNIARSVRFGGGLRVFLERGWFSSGNDEMLGVALYAYENGAPPWDQEAWKPYITEWGADPIWRAPGVGGRTPTVEDFPDAAAAERSVSLPTPAAGPGAATRRRVDVVGYPVAFDESRQLWFADITVASTAYSPFIRLALTRYQPYAIPDAKLSRVVLADFAQLVPGRSAVISADPYQPSRLRVTVSGVAPSGPVPTVTGPAQPDEPVPAPTQVTVSVQVRRDDLTGDLAWADADPGIATVIEQSIASPAELLRWTGTVQFAGDIEVGRYRLLICEYEYVSANHVLISVDPATGGETAVQPGRLIYAETVLIEAALLGR